MILSWVLLLSGCRFYDGPRNQSGPGCIQPALDLGSGRASTTLRANDWGDPMYPMEECDDGWTVEQALRWTPTRTGWVEITVGSPDGPVAVGFVTECPDLELRGCGAAVGTFILELYAVAGESVVLVVQGREGGEVTLDVREIAGSLDTDEPVDTGLIGRACGTAAPVVTDLVLFNDSAPGSPSMGVGFTMQDADGALHSIFPWLYVDDVVDGVVDPASAGTYGFQDPITDLGTECDAYGPYDLAFGLQVGAEIPFATEIEVGLVVVDADGLESAMVVASGYTPDENGQDFPPSGIPEDCSDLIDNDGDLAVDCADVDCSADPWCAFTCPTAVLTGAFPIVVNGTTAGAPNGIDLAGCATGDASEQTFTFTAPADATYTFSTAGSAYDTVLGLLDGCGGVELACNDDAPSGGLQSELSRPMASGDTVLVVVDGYGTAAGDFTLTVQMLP